MSTEKEIERAIRDLFANLLRISRSGTGGRDYEVYAQARRVLDAFEAHALEATHSMPIEAIRDAVDFSRSHKHMSDFDWFYEPILDGAAQVIASRLLGQRTQEAAGESQIMDGIRWREDAIKNRDR
jgi:hypothetical protein